jgi:hypothetical protein
MVRKFELAPMGHGKKVKKFPGTGFGKSTKEVEL